MKDERDEALTHRDLHRDAREAYANAQRVAEERLADVEKQLDDARKLNAAKDEALRAAVRAIEGSLPPGDASVGTPEFEAIPLDEVWAARERARAAIALTPEAVRDAWVPRSERDALKAQLDERLTREEARAVVHHYRNFEPRNAHLLTADDEIEAAVAAVLTARKGAK